jgi:hypothetical protein
VTAVAPVGRQIQEILPMRNRLAVVLAVVLLGLVAAPASAVGTQRTWRAGFSTGSVHGRATVSAFTDGTAQVQFNLKAMRRSSTYRVEIRAGSCSALGKVLVRVGSVVTDKSGVAAASRSLSQTQTNAVWSVGRTGTIAIRAVSGTSVTCGNLGYSRATRIRIPNYRIDLAVVPGPNGYPYCNVAMYQRVLGQPTEPGITFIYAHARTGMFLPLLTASKISNGAAMVGKPVYVYASNSVIHVYTITKVRRHVKTIQNAFDISSEVLWIQTSEGPNSTYPKLVIEAKRTGTKTTTYAASHPVPRIVRCG